MKDIEWVISEIEQRVEKVEDHEKTAAYNKGVARGLGISLFLINQLDKTEVKDIEWLKKEFDDLFNGKSILTVGKSVVDEILD